MKERDGSVPMSILYVSQFFPPESIAGAFRADEHSKAWVERGAKVTVLTGWPNYPTGSVFPGYKVKMLAEENLGDVRVLRSKLIAKSNTNFAQRVVSGMSFLVFGVLNILFNIKRIGRDFDIVLASSGTVFAGCLGLLFAKVHHLPFVIEFRDIAFLQMIATGTPEGSWKTRLMRSIELGLAKRARRVVVVTEGLKTTLVHAGIPADGIEVIPNGADIVELDLERDCNRLVFGYYGTMGISQDVLGTLDLIGSLGARELNLEYRIIGEGASKSEVLDALSSGKYPFAIISPGMAKSDLEMHYRETSICVVSLKNDDLFASSIPSKIFQSFARGIPVLFVGPQGEASRLVSSNCAGIALVGTPRENERDLTAFFMQDDWFTSLNEMGKNGTKLMKDRYSRKRLAESMLQILRSAVVEINDDR